MDQSQPLTASRLQSGSLDAMRLGAHTLDELAALVNWGNSQDFKPPTLVPWVELGPPSMEFKVVNNSDSTSPTETTSESPLPIESDTPQLAQAPSAPLEIKGSDEDGHFEIEHLSETDATDVADPDLLISEAVVNGMQSAERGVEDLSASAGLTEEEVAEGAAPAQPIAAMNAIPVEEAVAGESTLQAIPTQANRTPAPPAISTTNANRIGTLPMKMVRPTNIDPGEYLRRLESLVLGLNAQLAQQSQADEVQPRDELTWLRQRVIELSLHNLELQEQLATRNP